jgi:hypothetical protein
LVVLHPQFKRLRYFPADAGQQSARAGLRKAVEGLWQSRHTPKCGPDRSLVFLFADQDFGPNNEIVKFFKSVGRSIDLTKHNAKVALDDLKKIAKDPRNAPQVVGDVLDRGKAEAKRVLKRLFG